MRNFKSKLLKRTSKYLAVESQLILYTSQILYMQTCLLYRILVPVIFLLNGSLHPSYFKSITLAILSDVFNFYNLLDNLTKEEEKSMKLRLQLPIPFIQHAQEKYLDISHVFGLIKDIIEKYNCSADDVLLINELLRITNTAVMDTRLYHTYTILYSMQMRQGTLTPDDVSALYMIQDLLCAIYKPFAKTMAKLLVKIKEFNHILEDYIAIQVTMQSKVATPKANSISAEITNCTSADIEMEAEIEREIEYQGQMIKFKKSKNKRTKKQK
jgi:hypothetical protein